MSVCMSVLAVGGCWVVVKEFQRNLNRVQVMFCYPAIYVHEICHVMSCNVIAECQWVNSFLWRQFSTIRDQTLNHSYFVVTELKLELFPLSINLLIIFLIIRSMECQKIVMTKWVQSDFYFFKPTVQNSKILWFSIMYDKEKHEITTFMKQTAADFGLNNELIIKLMIHFLSIDQSTNCCCSRLDYICVNCTNAHIKEGKYTLILYFAKR